MFNYLLAALVVEVVEVVDDSSNSDSKLGGNGSIGCNGYVCVRVLYVRCLWKWYPRAVCEIRTNIGICLLMSSIHPSIHPSIHSSFLHLHLSLARLHTLCPSVPSVPSDVTLSCTHLNVVFDHSLCLYFFVALVPLP